MAKLCEAAYKYCIQINIFAEQVLILNALNVRVAILTSSTFVIAKSTIFFSRSLNKNTYNKPFSIVYLILDLEQCATRPNGRRTYWAWLCCCHLYWIVQARQSILCAITFEQFLATRYLPNTLYKRISRANWIFIFCIIAEYHKYHQPLDPLREALGDKKDLVVSWQKNKEWNHNFKFLLPIARRYQLDVGHIGTYCT